MARFRLRFLLQELDLHGPCVALGRSPACQVTIDDALVSRRHAEIILEGNRAQIRDLGSRNGVRVNGRLIRGEVELAHEDRIRLGSQDIIFLASFDEGDLRSPRSTGSISQCMGCSKPFPAESRTCPHCGTPSPDATNADGLLQTVTGILAEPESAWAFELLGEVVDRALRAGRVAEAERTLQRARDEVAQRQGGQAPVEASSLSRLGAYAVRLAEIQGKPDWAIWALSQHRSLGAMLSSELLDRLEKVDPELRESCANELKGVLEAWRDRDGTQRVSDQLELDRAGRLAALVA